MNLLVNAAQAIGDDEGTVQIQSRCDGDRVTISISDTGKGIAEENLKKVFDPFFTTKPIGEGTGLGLSITHGIIVQHQGTINLESAAGKGTTFVITLPIEIEPTPDE
jgi:signal transduction histidine kinase